MPMRNTVAARAALALVAVIVFAATSPSAASAHQMTALTPPTTGSFLYLNSQPGDYIGGGVEKLFTSSDSTVWASLPQQSTYFTARFLRGVLTRWFVQMNAPRGQPLAVGTYTGAGRAGFEPLGTPGLSI